MFFNILGYMDNKGLLLLLDTFLESVKCPNRPGLRDVNIWTENGADLENGEYLYLQIISEINFLDKLS